MFLLGAIPYQSLLPPLRPPVLLHVVFWDVWATLHLLTILPIPRSSYFVTSRGSVKILSVAVAIAIL